MNGGLRAAGAGNLLASMFGFYLPLDCPQPVRSLILPQQCDSLAALLIESCSDTLIDPPVPITITVYGTLENPSRLKINLFSNITQLHFLSLTD